MKFASVTFLKRRSQSKRRSPLKDKPLRNPGQSLDEDLERLLNGKAIVWIAAIVMSVAMVFIESRSGKFPTPWGVNFSASPSDLLTRAHQSTNLFCYA